MKKIALLTMVFMLVGCWPFVGQVPTSVVLGAKVLKKGTEKIQKDHTDYSLALNDYLIEQSIDNKKVLLDSQEHYNKGFAAMIRAINAQCDAIILLNEDEEE